MDANTITTLISSVGFPIVMCGLLAYYIKYTGDKWSKEREDSNTQHMKEMESITGALNNNTLALTRLCEKMEESNDN